MDRGIGGIGSIRDIGDPYDPRRGLPIIEQRNIPGLVAGKSAMLYTPSYLDDVAGYMARVAQAAGRNSPGNADPAAGVYVPSSGQLSLGIRPGKSTAESLLIPQTELALEQSVEAARRDNRALPIRAARPDKGDNKGRPLGILISGENPPRPRPEEREDSYSVGRAMQRGAYASFPDKTYLSTRPEAGDIAKGALMRLRGDEKGKRAPEGVTPQGQPTGGQEVGGWRRQSRVGRKAALAAESNGYASLTTPERAEAKLARDAVKAELSQAEQALMAVQLMRRATESPEERLFLDEYAQELADIVRAEGFNPDLSDRNVDQTGFSSEDPQEFRAKASGQDLRTIAEQPNWREREPVTYTGGRVMQLNSGAPSVSLSRDSRSADGGAGLPWYEVEARQRQVGGGWKRGGVDAYGGFDPSQAVEVPAGYEREGDFNEDATASFLREKQINAGEAVGRMLDAGKTPVISRGALVEAYRNGRFEPLSQADALARKELARSTGQKDTLVGYLRRDGEELPVYRPGLGSARLVPDPENPLNGVISEDSEIYRIGSPVNREYDAVRDYVRSLAGGYSEPGVRGEITLAPLISDAGVRRTVEKKMGGISQSDFFNQIASGAMMMDPDEANALRGVLAEAASTGEMPVVFRATKDAPRTRGSKPMRGTVESLYSGIDPKTGRNPAGQDAPDVTAGKQLRAFLQEAPRALTTREAVDVATAIGARWGVDANAALRAAAAQVPAMGRGPQGALTPIPGRTTAANDPGRPLFGRGSYALQLLDEARREGSGRMVDLFAEPAGDAPIAGDLAALVGGIEDAEEVRRREGQELAYQAGFQSAAPAERLIGEDPLGSYIEYAKQFTSGNEAQAREVVEQVLKNSPGVLQGEFWKRPGETQLEPIRAINEFMAPPVEDVRVGSANFDPVAADRIRMAYRASPAGTVRPEGIPGTATFGDLARVIGGQVGSDAQEQAMALLASRIAQRRQAIAEAGTGASALGQAPFEPMNRDAAMIRRRALGVLGR